MSIPKLLAEYQTLGVILLDFLIEEKILVVKINRPEKMNALNRELLLKIAHVFYEIRKIFS